ncbi:MAG: peptidylprolyl isomerase [Mariniblastus sp.]|nr:peptidylprolyl isomerase [Mariniblastus sp.]
MVATKHLLIFLILIIGASNSVKTTQAQTKSSLRSVSPIPDKVRAKFKLDSFYQKYIDVGGLPIVGSGKVSDAAILEAAWIVTQMIGHRPNLLQAMAENNTRLAVMAYNEFTTDIPEHRHLKSRVFWDRRARGLGATPSAPAVSCAEENLLCHPGDPYSTENICIHEFAHAIHIMGMKTVDPTFEERLTTAYQAAIKSGLWKDTYAAGNRQEYWAEAVQSWFDDNREKDALHNHVNTRSELKIYDPALARLCEQVFGDREWRYKKPTLRSEAARAHLAKVDFENLPKFKWRNEAIPAAAKALIQTTMGDIEIELNYQKAPLTVANFLHYVHAGLYSDGEFHRTVRVEDEEKQMADNQPLSKIKISVIQASADPKKKAEFPNPIPLERTRDTSLKHLNGSISMARDTNPDSGRDHFFICIGDQPELDFAGKRNPDGQGFAVFGKVTQGMDVVKKIHAAPADGQSLKPKILIQRAIRLN